MKIKKLYGSGIILVGFSLGTFWFGWKLLVVLILTLWGNNIEQSDKK